MVKINAETRMSNIQYFKIRVDFNNKPSWVYYIDFDRYDTVLSLMKNNNPTFHIRVAHLADYIIDTGTYSFVKCSNFVEDAFEDGIQKADKCYNLYWKVEGDSIDESTYTIQQLKKIVASLNINEPIPANGGIMMEIIQLVERL